MVGHPQVLLEVAGKQGMGSGRTESALTQISGGLWGSSSPSAALAISLAFPA